MREVFLYMCFCFVFPPFFFGSGVASARGELLVSL